MSEEFDDNEFFQQDFTTASEWEVFTARLEEIFHEWKLPYADVDDEPLEENQLSFCDWIRQNEIIKFADVEINVTRYCATLPSKNGNANDDVQTGVERQLNDNRKCQAFIDIMAMTNTYCLLDDKFNDTIHPLARWYGLRDFVVISPVHKAITNTNQIQIILSSIHIAVAACNCDVPVFVQALEQNQHVYTGLYRLSRLHVCIQSFIHCHYLLCKLFSRSMRDEIISSFIRHCLPGNTTTTVQIFNGHSGYV